MILFGSLMDNWTFCGPIRCHLAMAQHCVGRPERSAGGAVRRANTWVRQLFEVVFICGIFLLISVSGSNDAIAQWEDTAARGQLGENKEAPALATLQPIHGLGKQVKRPVASESSSENSLKVPALSAGFRQESLPPSKQQSQQEHRTSQEVARDQEIIKLLKPLPIEPKSREVLTQRYPNGKIQIEREVKRDDQENYLNDGKWKKYHTDGQLMGIGRFQEGQMVGLWKRVHFDRDSPWFQTKDFQGFQFPLISSAEFKDGQLEGLWVIKDSEQKKIFELRYENGRRNGSGTWWYPSGEKRRELNCQDDLLHGLWQEWDETGKLVRENWFREGRRIARNVSYFRENRPETEQSFLDPKLELVEADDWWNATLGRYEASGEATQEGPVRAWYDNGQRHMAGFYKANVKDGEFAWWHPNGTRKLLGQYEDGLRTGKWIWWHENGIKAAEVEFEAGAPVTDLLTWNEQGIRVVEPESTLSEDRQSTAKPPIDLESQEEASDPEDLPEPKNSIELVPQDSIRDDDESAPVLDIDDLDLIGSTGNASELNLEPATDPSSKNSESETDQQSEAKLPPPKPND